jgi:hypothetical protein
MSALGKEGRRWLLTRMNVRVRIGLQTAHSGYKNQDMTRLGMGLGLVLYGMVHRRRVRRLIYATSIDLDEGMSIRVMRGRRPIAEITPIP